MAKAFLSHSSKDKELVRKIAKKLGYNNCVIDEISFEAGAKTLDEIFNELNDSDIFVLFLSDASLNSKWVQREIGFAHKALYEDKVERILPIIIDAKVSFSDSRIPKWLAKEYNLRYISSEVIIYHKIRDALRDVNFKRNNHNQELERIFVGRNEEMAKFERDINNLEGWTPTYIIAYNYYQGIGRRTFLKNALLKARFITKPSSQKPITIDGKESIESFIYKLNTICEEDAVFKSDLTKMSVDEKIDMATRLSKEFMQNREIIFIEDNGGIVLPNKQIAPWFKEITHQKDFDNTLVFCIISKFRPNEQLLEQEKRSLVYMIPELKKDESTSLFVNYLKVYGHDSISKNDKMFFLKHLKGIPAQIIYAAKMIDINLIEAKKNIHEIDEFSDQFSKILLEKIVDNNTAYQIAILLSQNEVFSMTLIYKVFGENEDTNSAIQLLIDLSLLTFLFGGYEYLSLNMALADYISRSRITLMAEYSRKLKEEIRKLLKKDLDKVLVDDYSAFMLTLQSMLREDKKIPSKFFMPSLLLKNVIMLYNQGNYYQVIQICDKLLNETNYDEQIIWETRYWQTAAMANNKDARALENLSYFKPDSIAYHFLKGFYYRNIGEKAKALESFYQVLRKDENHPRSKREIVNILLSQAKYAEALEMARENYNQQKTNIYHIQSYFISLIRRNDYLVPEDIRTLNTLMKNMESSLSSKAEDMLRCMKGEFAYYVNKDIQSATQILLEASCKNENKSYPKKSLLEIYKNAKRLHEYRKLNLEEIDESYTINDFE